ncbi:GNAT family N-acetyltransferase [Celeribacter litoreus]|uniref:GNAT family N-acetyltransferase n=1 Tax=Celeribacter litoreus TaxID=2876714 RepID=UPI001CCD3DF4|nr:GNAT family N-acetyltransferase [Celeribacter litoreus]MCA0043304.1 GNAT family N-acetyltransferase [Celeribacter litoreus]
MEVREIISKAEWDALTDQATAPLTQRWLYGAAAELCGRDCMRLGVFKDGQPLAITQVVGKTVLGFNVGLTSQGPLFFTDNTRPALRALRHHLPLGFHVMTPRKRLRRLPLSAPPQLATLDLTPSLPTIRSTFHGKWRNALVKAERAVLDVQHTSPTADELMPLLQLEKERQSERHYRALPPEFALALHAADATAFHLFATDDAGMLFLRHGNTATYHIGHSGPHGRKTNAHNLLLWSAVKYFHDEGVKRLELGTLNPSKAPDLARFKLRTGAVAETYAPASLL